MVCVFIGFIDFNGGSWTFHKVNSKKFKILIKGLIVLDNDRVSVLDYENVFGG
jgi:hypothetical protein